MNISENNVNNYTILSLQGILNASSAPKLKTYIAGIPEEQSLIIDLENVESIITFGVYG